MLLNLLLISMPTYGLVVADNFTGNSNQENWLPIAGACLTARADTITNPGNGKIPSCKALEDSGTVTSPTDSGGVSGAMPDPIGQGALRLTNNTQYQKGGIIYKNWFPANSGVDITWTSVAYGGTGADGISFFLVGNNSNTEGDLPSQLGSFGGSLGYSCSNINNPYYGIKNGYLGIGMDEFGNFSNRSDTTATGASQNTRNPDTIVVRGAGNVTGQAYPNQDLKDICRTGQVNSLTINDYPFISIPGVGADGLFRMPSGESLSSRGVLRRSQAVPISYRLQISENSLLNLWYRYHGGALKPIIQEYDITQVSGTLPPFLTFGFAGSTGAETNFHEIICFQASPKVRSAAGADPSSGSGKSIQLKDQIYFVDYRSEFWAGDVVAHSLQADAITNEVSVATNANWNASCALTGGACQETGAVSGTAQSPTSRTILTWNPDSQRGAAFRWNTLTSTQQSALNSDQQGVNRLNYLRGERTNEITASGSGLFRVRRGGVLGDIINSSPILAGAPSENYTATWTDLLHNTAMLENASGAQTYPDFITQNRSRTNVVYVGANDGMLHGFSAGSYDDNEQFVSTENTGRELLAYVPNTIFNQLSNYATSTYNHTYYVDVAPAVGDVFYQQAWHTWLVGGLGAGGRGIYVLDITNPSSSNFSESNAQAIVRSEVNNSTISCVGNTSCGQDLGFTHGTPVITRFHNGQWGAVFGNGADSQNGVGAIFIMLIDPATGAISYRRYSSGYGPAQDPSGGNNKNGIFYTTVVDLDGDHVADYIYAGDLFGNIWRFDVTSTNPNNWGVSTYHGMAKPLFSAPAGSATGDGHPITSKISVMSLSASSASPRVMVYVGTGRKIPFTLANPDLYSQGQQAFYGVWDWNMGDWNGMSTRQYQALSQNTQVPVPLGGSNLVEQTLLQTFSSTNTAVQAYGSVSHNPVCWVDSTACGAAASNNQHYGWRFTLPNSTESAIFNSQITQGSVLFNTVVPGAKDPFHCVFDEDSGWTYALNPATGGSSNTSFFANDAGKFSGEQGYSLNAIKAGAVGGFQTVSYKGKTYIAFQTQKGTVSGNIVKVMSGSGKPHRLSWIELR